MTKMASDYFRSGAWGENTLRWNVQAWEQIRVYHRAMVDVSKRSTATTLLGSPSAFPFIIAPAALHKLACKEGEIATARAASSRGVPLILSSLSSTGVEEVCRAAKDVDVWMQLYIGKERSHVLDLAARAHAAGCKALVLTVDAPVWGVRERDIRNGFCLPPDIEVVNLMRSSRDGAGHGAEGGLTGHSGAGIAEALGWTIDASLSWKDLDWLVSKVSLPIMVKGICRVDDACRAVDAGAKGVLVSNHGGRQLDGAPATAESLEAVADAVGDRACVIVDGGIRRGVDVLRALALGAHGASAARPILWGLGAGGEAGVARVLELLQTEFDLAMALAGCATLEEITADLLLG
ncbi:MAG: alpha-hydroxy-acid oxidizing protein [Phycisphaerales bacterium]|nr:alpha-hydroxy-acid oxidizing protein [Phycisphaerales bacterium]